ncbi:hypothetical protein OS493_033962 [Desmophyllum pertusum]|uniref:Uncharacterized protein n=1 Tax=Desmophyllum pertusum TaxID=174260 RepID=A0A9X0D2N3_9CNID|nr:hypothetical protein OS493_033962 [Desmophyllum pertusum]
MKKVTPFADRKVESDNEDSCESVAVLQKTWHLLADKKLNVMKVVFWQGDSAWSNDEMTTSKFLADLKHTLLVLVTRKRLPGSQESICCRKQGWNSLHSASQGGDLAIIETMLSLGLDIDSRDSFGTTPLWFAAASGNMQAVRIFSPRVQILP